MNCNEFWTKYEGTGLTPELERHLAICKQCQMDMQIESALDRSLKFLPGYQAPDRIWDAIVNELPKKSSPVIMTGKKISGMLRNIVPIVYLRKPRQLLAGISVILIITVSVFYLHNRPLTTEQKLKKQAEAIERIEKAEREYLSSIAHLSELAEANKDNIPQDLYDVYQNELAMLDGYILECREVIKTNSYNPQARTYLALAYMKKTDTLKEMVAYK